MYADQCAENASIVVSHLFFIFISPYFAKQRIKGHWFFWFCCHFSSDFSSSWHDYARWNANSSSNEKKREKKNVSTRIVFSSFGAHLSSIRQPSHCNSLVINSIVQVNYDQSNCQSHQNQRCENNSPASMPSVDPYLNRPIIPTKSRIELFPWHSNKDWRRQLQRAFQVVIRIDCRIAVLPSLLTTCATKEYRCQ